MLFRSAIQSALREMIVPLIGSTITPIVVFLPLVSTTGVFGSFFRALAITMTVALLSSLLLAVTWTPTLSQYFVRRKDSPVLSARAGVAESTASPLLSDDPHLTGRFGRIVDFYSRVMTKLLHRPILLLILSAVVVSLAYLCYSFLGSDLLPEMDEGAFILDYNTPPGSSLAESDRILQRIEKIIRAVPEVENTSRRTGLQLGLASVTEANRGDFTVKLKRDRKRPIDDIDRKSVV